MTKKNRILVLRTAKMQVVDLLMENLGRECDITFLAQNNIIMELKKKYPYSEVISIHDTYFSYDSFRQNVHLNGKFDCIYVLASGITFTEYEEVFQIVEHIKHKKLILFNKNGIKSVEQHSVFNVLVDKIAAIFVGMYMVTVEFWYKYFGSNYRF